MNKNDRIVKIVAQGRTRFVLVRGVLVWGLLTATLVTAFALMQKKDMHMSEVVITFIVFPVMGIFWGLGMWAHLEKKAAKILAK